MTRTKWMRLGVKDPADILRWAAAQNTRRLDELRHRVIRGREFVSFRMVPRYRVEIGTTDIIVVAHVRATARQRLAAAVGAQYRRAVRQVCGALRPRPAVAPVHAAGLYRLPEPRLSSPLSR